MSSSLSSVVSNLVRASMGTSVSSTITDEDLDRHVAELILKEAKKKAERYSQQGIRAYLRNNVTDSNAPKTNKRFLSSIIRNTDDHNKTILRAQTLAAQEIKQARAEAERRERRARAEEAAQAERMRRSSKSAESWDRWDGRTADRNQRLRSWETWDRDTEEDNEEEYERSKKRRKHRHRSISSERPPKARHRHRHSRRHRDHSQDRVLDDDVEDAYSLDINSRKHHRSSHRRHRSDHRHRRRRRSSSRSPSRRSCLRSNSHSRSPPPVRYSGSRNQSKSPHTTSRSPCADAHSLLPADEKECKGKHKASDEGSASPRQPYATSSTAKQVSSPRASSSSSCTAMSLSEPDPRSPTPGPDPPSSKMDRYFEESYDPRLDTAPLATPNVPATGLINNAEFEGWDAMLELIRLRKADKEEKKRMERLGLLPKVKTKDNKGPVMLTGVNERWNSNSNSLMDIEYSKRGSIREWDLGKEGL